jgi:hypothetical protein
MITLTSVLGWIALVAFGICFAAMFYTYYAAKKVLKAVAERGSSSDVSLSSEARSTLEKDARARIKWLKGNQTRFPEDIKSKARRPLQFDVTSQVAFWTLLVLWLLVVLLDKLK